jgi:hypothetical protein
MGAQAATVLEMLRKDHEAAHSGLVGSEEERQRISQKMEEVFAEGHRRKLGNRIISWKMLVRRCSWSDSVIGALQRVYIPACPNVLLR